MSNKSYVRREIIRIYKEQIRVGTVNVKEIRTILGSKTSNYIYKIISEEFGPVSKQL